MRNRTATEVTTERRTLTGRDGINAAHRRFGGLDMGATIAGAFAALGLTVLLGGIFAGAGRVVYVNGLRDAPTAATGSLIAGLAVLVIAFLVGGWVAGRMARYDGGRNGMVTAVWFVLFAAGTSAVGALLGESYNVFAGDRLPQWFTDSARTTGAIASAAIAFVLMLGAGYVGGLAGDRYHRRVDRMVAGLTPVETEVPAPRREDRANREERINEERVAPTDRDPERDAVVDDERARGRHLRSDPAAPLGDRVTRVSGPADADMVDRSGVNAADDAPAEPKRHLWSRRA